MQHSRLSQSSELYRMIYCSQLTTTGMLGVHTLKEIVQQAAKHNWNNRITGVLCYGDGYFLQYVESDEQALTDLKNELVSDTRHRNMKILDFSMIPSRHFSNWLMKEITLDKWMAEDPTIAKMLPFNPMDWDNKKMNYFITLLKEKYTRMSHEHHRHDQAEATQSIPQTLGIAVTNIVTKHQAFIVVQAMIGVLIALCIILVFFVSQT